LALVWRLNWIGVSKQAAAAHRLATPQTQPKAAPTHQPPHYLPPAPNPKPPTGDLYGACLVLAVGSFGIGQWRTLGSANVGLGFSQSVQMLVFYTASIRLMAESIGLFGSGEKLGWLANHTPQEGGRLAAPALKGERQKKKGKSRSSVGRSLPAPEVRGRARTWLWRCVWVVFGCVGFGFGDGWKGHAAQTGG